MYKTSLLGNYNHKVWLCPWKIWSNKDQTTVCCVLAGYGIWPHDTRSYSDIPYSPLFTAAHLSYSYWTTTQATPFPAHKASWYPRVSKPSHNGTQFFPSSQLSTKTFTMVPKMRDESPLKNSRHIWDKFFSLFPSQKWQALPVSFQKAYRFTEAESFSFFYAITRSPIQHILYRAFQIYLSRQRIQIKNETTISLAWQGETPSAKFPFLSLGNRNLGNK